MGNLVKHANKLLDVSCLVAAAANVGLFIYSTSEGYHSLQLLSILNIFLLSFRLLKVSNET